MNIKETDAKFERDLSLFNANVADRIIFHLGKPSSKVRSAGVPDKELKLYGSKVMKKIRKHGFGVNELKGLTKGVRNPIAVFKNKNASGMFSILTSLKTKNGNFLVTITQGAGQDATFNIVSSVFGKGHENIVDWINRGFLRYVDKKKALSYLNLSNLSVAASNNKELSSATKIVKTFRNNKLSGRSLTNG